MRVEFEKVSIGKRKRVWTENGKRRQETKEFWQTISPFNVNEDGTRRDRMQILGALHAEAAVWVHAKELTQADTGAKHVSKD